MSSVMSGIYNPGKCLTVCLDNKSYTLVSDHPNFSKAVDAYKAGDSKKFLTLTDIPKSIHHFSKGKVAVKDSKVYYDGVEVHNVVCNRIVSYMAEGLDFKPLMRFLEKLMSNPSKRALEELYPFMERNHMPVTADGDVLGYKRCNNEWRDFHSDTVDNKIGTQVTPFPRNMVDDNFGVACSQGYHIGSIGYVKNFHANEGHITIVKFNPADVVSVPSNENKLRATTYFVLSEYVGDLTEQLYQNDGGAWDKSATDEDDWDEDEWADWDDEEDIDEDEDEFDEDDAWPEDDDEDEDDDDFCPKFQDGDDVVFNQETTGDDTVYTVIGDSFIEDGEERVNILYKGHTYLYDANMLEMAD